MKPFVFVVVLALALTFSASAQGPAQLQHENRVYLNDGNTYVQKSLPLYLKFSTSPGGQLYDLKSKSTPKYADPMYLDTEGINYIRSKWAVDPSTGKTASPQQEVMYELYADGLAPVTSIKFSGAPKYTGSKVYYGKGLTVDLSARDGVSGVEKIHYALNASSWSDYSSALQVNSENEYNLYYYTNDNVGNAEQTKSRNFVVDLTAPSSNIAINGIKFGENILSPSTTFSLSSTDALSGVRSTYYDFDGGSRRNYTGNIGMGGLKDGQHTINYWAIDRVKNEAAKQTLSFYLDLIPPVSQASINGDLCEKRYKYVSPRTTISIAATDNKAGVKNIYYRIDGGERFIFNQNFNIPNTTGVHTVKYDANDNVDNLSGNTYLTVFMDNRAPETGIKYGRPQFFARDTLFVTSKTNISLFARDGESGVTKTQYEVDGAGMKDYAQFTIPSEGYHTINFKSTDCVNNEEQVKTSNCYVDNSAPTIYNNFSIEPIGTKKKNGKTVMIYPNYTRLYLGATDDHVGTDRILYSMNGGALTDYSSPQTLDISELNRFKNKKFYTVKVVSRDKLGNESETTIEFYVGRQGDE
jgi:hypothetical protein